MRIRTWMGFALTSTFLQSLLFCSSVSAQANLDGKARGLDFDTRLRYTSALVNGVPTLNVLVASEMGKTAQATKGFEALGGHVVERFDTVGYFWGSISTTQFNKLTRVPEIVAVELDGSLGALLDYREPSDKSKLRAEPTWPRVDAEDEHDQSKVAQLPVLTGEQLRGDNPYLPWSQVGVTEYRRQHPTFDGRGTTIALVEDGFGDLSNPTLQNALTLDGKPIPKVAGIMDVSDEITYVPRAYSPRPPVVSLRTEVSSATSQLLYGNATWTLPAPGSYRIAELSADGRSFEVLYSPQRQSVWVDTNRNHSFADETELKDINRQFSYGTFPAEPQVAGKPHIISSTFALTIDPATPSVRFFLRQDNHMTSVASISAGQGFLGTDAGGVAPGARVLYVQTELDSLHQIVKAYIAAASRPDVDAVSTSWVIKPAIPGESVTSLILDRAAAVYDKPMFFIEGTDESIIDPGDEDGSHLFSIAGDSSKDTLLKFFGIEVPMPHNVKAGGFGPGNDGTLKPDIVVPHQTLAASACIRAGSPFDFRFGDFKAPPCYTNFRGDSAQAPIAAGLAALLISGAKQQHLQHGLDRIGWVLRNSGTYMELPEPAGEQGGGLANIEKAWELLSSNEPTPRFSINTATNGPMEDYRHMPREGVAVVEYSGWHPGSRGRRVLTMIRHSGPPAKTQYLLRWRGNDGTFSAPEDVKLPLNVPVQVPIGIATKQQGRHQAILSIVDPSNNDLLHSILNTVVAAQPLNIDTSSARWETKLPAGEHDGCAFFDIGTSSAAVNVRFSMVAGETFLRAFAPYLMGPNSFLRRSFDNPDPYLMWLQKPGSREMLLGHPVPGTWGFCITNGIFLNRQMLDQSPFMPVSLNLSVLKTNVETRNVKAAASSGHTVSAQVTVHNQGVAISNAGLLASIGYVQELVPHTAPEGTPSEMDFTASENMQDMLLDFTRNGAAPDASVFIYNCPFDEAGKAGSCLLQDYREKPTSIEYRLPRSGNWKIFVYPASIASAATPNLHVSILRVPAPDGQAPLPKIPHADEPLALDARWKTAELSWPRKLENIEAIGPLAVGASATRNMRIDLPLAQAPGKAVLLIQTYDLDREADGRKEEHSLFFDSTHSRPVALGQAVVPLQVAK